MSADAPQPAIDALRSDKHVIVIEEKAWFQNLHRTIHHAATRKNFENYLYDPIMQIFGTYAKTCSHKDYEVAVIPQGCFELRTDSSKRVTRKLSDALFAFHCKPTGDPSDPKCGKSRLGGWVEGKPWVQLPEKAKKKGAANTDKNVDASEGNIDGQGNGSQDIAEEEVGVDRECSAEEGTDTGEEDTAAEQRTDAREKDAASDEEDTVSDEDTASDEDTTSEEGDLMSDEEDIALDEAGTDVDEDREDPDPDTGEETAMSADGPSFEDASALILDNEEVTQRLVKDLPQLCEQAYFAFDHFDDNELVSFITYGMTFSCFKFLRPANWDSIRGDKNGIVEAPIPIYSNERMVFQHHINPCLNKALRLMTASLDLTYQPSWFDPPTHDIPEPDLSVAQGAIDLYNRKINGVVPGSSPERRPTKPVKGDSPYVVSSSDGTAPVMPLRPRLRSGIGGAATSETDLDSAESEGTETSESTPEAPEPTLDTPEPTSEHANPASSDTEESSLSHHLQSQSAQSEYAHQETDAHATSSIFGTRGPSTEDTRTLADNAPTPALASASGVSLNSKFLTPKNRGERIPEVPRGEARQKKIDFHNNVTDSALPPLLSSPIYDGPTNDGLSGSGLVLGHLPTSQAAIDGDSRTGASSRAKSGKRKGWPSSPLGADSPNLDATEDSTPAMAGPSKKRRLLPQIDEQEQPADDSAGGPSRTSRMEIEVSAGATNAKDDTETERVYDRLTAPERRRLNPHVYESSRARKRAAKTAETTTSTTGPEVPRPRARVAIAGPSQVRDPSPKERGKKKTRK